MLRLCDDARGRGADYIWNGKDEFKLLEEKEREAKKLVKLQLQWPIHKRVSSQQGGLRGEGWRQQTTGLLDNDDTVQQLITRKEFNFCLKKTKTKCLLEVKFNLLFTDKK